MIWLRWSSLRPTNGYFLAALWAAAEKQVAGSSCFNYINPDPSDSDLIKIQLAR
jgi:hypothetical protein